MTNLQRLDEEDRNVLFASVERLARQYYDVERCRISEIVCGADEWNAFAEQGVFAIGISPEYGGIGGGVRDQAMVMQQIGYNLLPLPYLDGIIAARSIALLGTRSQAQDLLPALAEGRLRIGFAHREVGAGDVFDHVTTRASGGRLSGEKIQVLDGVLGDKFLVTARDDDDVLRMFLVDRATPGLTVQNYRLVDNRLASRLVFADVAAEALGNDAAGALALIHQEAAACAAAETVGAMSGLNRDTVDYAKVRRQFGQSIGSFQVIQHRLVDMFIAEQLSDALVAQALEHLDAGADDAALLVSAAKAQADRAGRQVGESAIQIYGGMGMTDECSVGHFLKRILTNGSQFGTAGWHVANIAQRAG